MFDRRDEGRAKTGKAAIGTISRRTERLVTAYLAALGANLHPDAILFRNRSGNPYRQETLADDFGTLREAIFPGDQRRLMNMRRSATLEAIAGGAEGFALAAKMANSIEHSNASTEPMHQSTRWPSRTSMKPDCAGGGNSAS